MVVFLPSSELVMNQGIYRDWLPKIVLSANCIFFFSVTFSFFLCHNECFSKAERQRPNEGVFSARIAIHIQFEAIWSMEYKLLSFCLPFPFAFYTEKAVWYPPNFPEIDTKERIFLLLLLMKPCCIASLFLLALLIPKPCFY